MGESRRCARPGCRAWAMRGRRYCRMHISDEEPPRQADDLGGLAPEQRAAVERRVNAVLARLTEQSGTAGGSLAEEIEALRLVLVRLLVEEPDSARLAVSIPRVVDATVRAVRVQQTLGGAAAENLTEALTQVLVELGLGSEGA